MFSVVKESLQRLQQGDIILYPTDTIWGIGCDATNATAIQRIYQLKQRDDRKSLIILLAEAKDIFQYVANPHPDIIGIINAFTKPTTIIYDQAIGLPNNLINQDGSIAIRVTKDPFCKSLIKRLKKPLVSTSANISGSPSPSNFNDISPVIKEGVDYIVNWRQGEVQQVPPSSIIRIFNDGSQQIIRP
jgi:L-threonylcarbamoyladenylate synthase